MKERASAPQFSAELNALCGAGWVVNVTYLYEPDEPVAVVHATNRFPTEDEALAFVAETNGGLQ